MHILQKWIWINTDKFIVIIPLIWKYVLLTFHSNVSFRSAHMKATIFNNRIFIIVGKWNRPLTAYRLQCTQKTGVSCLLSIFLSETVIVQTGRGLIRVKLLWARRTSNEGPGTVSQLSYLIIEKSGFAASLRGHACNPSNRFLYNDFV